MSANCSHCSITSYPASGELLSTDFDLKVGSQAVPVYSCRVSAVPFNQVWPGYQRPLDQTELASFGYWDMPPAATVKVEIVSCRPVESVVVRPISRGIKPTVDGDRITFHLSGPGQVVVEVNGWHHALHLFANPPVVDVPSPDDPNVRYFGPGVHRAGKICVGSNQTIYIAGGAIVYGAIEARGASNVRILGRGILDTSGFERVQLDPNRPATDVPGSRLDTSGFDRGRVGGCLHLTDCRNVVVEGIILRDPNEWCVALFGCQKVDISNIKLIGLWRYNADGIDVCNGRDVTIRDSFIRAFDDCIVVKALDAHRDVPARNILAERCVVWCDWGRAFHVGLETCAPEMSNLVFRDSDLIRASYVAMDIQHGDRAAIHNVLFENIRVEMDDAYLSLQLQKNPEDKYQFIPHDPFVPFLLGVEIMKSFYNVDTMRGTVENVTFRNISVTGQLFPRSQLMGWDAAHGVRGVTIENLSFNGRAIRTLQEAGVEIGKFVHDVRLRP